MISQNLRHPRPKDLQRTLALLVRGDIAEYGEADTDLDDLEHEWRSIDLDRDAWLVDGPEGEPIGYAAVMPWGPKGIRYELRVAPDIDGAESIASSLLARCESRGPSFAQERLEKDGHEQAKDHVDAHTFIAHVDRLLPTLVTDTGFTTGRTYHQMRIDTRSAPTTRPTPAGLRLRTFDRERDEHEVHALIEAAFDQPGREPSSLEDWRAHMLRPEIFDAEIWFLAEEAKRLVGACLCVDYPTGGWVRQLAVAPEAQGRGIGSALLQRAFAVFHERGAESVALSVESLRPDAHRFYLGTGMTESRRYDEYVKRLELP